MSQRWVLPLVFLIVAPLSLPAQEAKPAEKLAAVRSSLAKVKAMGSKARLTVGRYRRKCKVVAAEPMFLFLRSELGDMKPVGEVPKRAKIKELVASFGKDVSGFVALGESALPVIKTALESEEDAFQKRFLEQLRLRLVSFEALKAIHRYIVDNQERGSFDGMFDDMKRFDALACQAFLDIFSYSDHDSTVRRLARRGGRPAREEGRRGAHGEGPRDPRQRIFEGRDQGQGRTGCSRSWVTRRS